jgi:hypothetical protein
MNTTLNIVGGVLVLFGAIWFLQGTNLCAFLVFSGGAITAQTDTEAALQMQRAKRRLFEALKRRGNGRHASAVNLLPLHSISYVPSRM